MNILIDGRVWSKNAAGVTTFLNCALLEWAHQRRGDTFYVVLPKGFDKSIELGEVPANIKLLDYVGKYPRRLPNILILQCLMPRLCRKLNIDLYYAPVPHLPYFIPRRVTKLITVHDVVNIEMKETMAWTNRLATSMFFGRAIKRADRLWANSFYTKSKVNQYYPNRKSNDIFVGDASDGRLFKPMHLTDVQKEAIKQEYGVHGKMLLFVGSLEPRKNLGFLIRLMPKLYQEHGIQLVVVGGKGWKNSDLRQIVESPDFPKESVIFCGYVTNAELVRLYNTADCFVSAALMEGFGMPQLEALMCGCPIVTAHNTAMIEVARGKDAATTVEGYDKRDWEQAILRTLEECPQVNPSQIAEYDWTTIIQGLVQYLNIATL